MGEFNFEKAVAMAKAAEQGESLPPREQSDRIKKSVSSFDFQTVVDRAKQKQTTKTEDLEESPEGTLY